MRLEIKIAGFGGQGVGLAGYILGQAFALYENLEAVMTQSYGPEARGGASSSSIVVSDEPIDYPFVQQADILVALSQEAYTKFQPSTKPEGQILIDEELVTHLEDRDHLVIPATQLAERLGRRIVTNVVMLGFFTAVTKVVTRSAVEQALAGSVPPKILSLNQNAFTTGFEYGQAYTKGISFSEAVPTGTNGESGGGPSL
jgi:2-oxoglutarate ferredoxin oxidoreductase subunit gamma